MSTLLPHGLDEHRWVPLGIHEHIPLADINKAHDEWSRKRDEHRRIVQEYKALHPETYWYYSATWFPEYIPPRPRKYIVHACPCGDYRYIELDHIDAHIENVL